MRSMKFARRCFKKWKLSKDVAPQQPTGVQTTTTAAFKSMSSADTIVANDSAIMAATDAIVAMPRRKPSSSSESCSWLADPEIDWDTRTQCPGCMELVNFSEVDMSKEPKICPLCGTSLQESQNEEHSDDADADNQGEHEGCSSIE